MVNGQLDARGVGRRVVRQQVQCRNVGGDDMRWRKALRRPVGRGVGRVGVGDLRVVQQIGGLSHVPQGLTQRGGRAEGVAVGPHVGQQQHIVQRAQVRRCLLYTQPVSAHS